MRVGELEAELASIGGDKNGLASALAEAEATRLVRARLLQADQMKTRIQAEARSRMETAKIALKSAQDNSLIRSEEADRAKAAVETADEEARARVRAEEAARREKAEIDRIVQEADKPDNTFSRFGLTFFWQLAL